MTVDEMIAEYKLMAKKFFMGIDAMTKGVQTNPVALQSANSWVMESGARMNALAKKMLKKDVDEDTIRSLRKRNPQKVS